MPSECALGSPPGTTAHRLPLTADRIEHKYAIDARDCAALMGVLDAHICLHHHDPSGSDEVEHWATTVYFDTACAAVRRSAERGGTYGKLRVREYYDVLPASSAIRGYGSLWIELKVRDEHRSSKHRLCVPKSSAAELFQGAVRLDRILERPASDWTPGAASRAVVRDWVEALPTLTPCVVVSYRRRAWQDPRTCLRVTLDDEIASYRPDTSALWSEPPCAAPRWGAPTRHESGSVLEVKCDGPLPSWLAFALPVRPESTRYSKFLRACHALHGPLER